MNMLYTEYFKQFDFDEYNVILIYSDLFKLIQNSIQIEGSFDGQTFLDSIKQNIKQHQTLLIPTFNWEFCNGKGFDYNKTPSSTGYLGNLALQDKDFKRTKHPIYSFAVYGKDKDILFSNDYKSSFGADSVFAYMYNNKSVQLGISLNKSTIGHYIEEVLFGNKIPYRYLKTFKNRYIDEYGNQSMKEYTMFVRDYDKNVTFHAEEFYSYLVQKGYTKEYIYNDIPFYVTDIKVLCDIIYNDLEQTGGSLFQTYIGQKGIK